MARAKTSPCPAKIAPQLVTLANTPPRGGNWLFELKWDGFRMMARFDQGVRLFTRNGFDWTQRMPRLVKELETLNIVSAWIDGEVIIQDKDGRPVFQPLQSAFSSGKTDELMFFAFDLMHLNGRDMRSLPVEIRRERLRELIENTSLEHVRFSETLDVDPHHLLANVCKMEMEGIVGKRAGSPYASERNGDWIKIKCHHRQEFVVLGYTRAAAGIGSLLIGLHDDAGELIYSGRVKSGFDSRTLIELRARLGSLERAESVLKDRPQLTKGLDVVWLEPELVCEIKYAEITPNGRVRHGVFKGMRDDKPAAGISLESSTPEQPPEPRKTQIRITHGERVIDPSTGLTKGQLAEYYARVADWMLPLLHDRPVSLVRAPDGIEGEQFFQRNTTGLAIPDIESINRPSGKPAMLINTPKALLSAVQMSAIEIHAWNATTADLSRPDRFILDLDPDPALPWVRMIEATNLVCVVLQELGLVSFLKTSGGKGIHIVVPLTPEDDWAAVKTFSHAIVKHIAKLIPDRFSAVSGPKNRVGRIFIDYLRNSSGATTVAAYSVRARPGLAVSVPIWPEELSSLQGAHIWTIQNIFKRLDSLNEDPWATLPHTVQTITAHMRKQLGIRSPARS
jgi:bifunctional non-homologous end joining protein LigD